MALLVVLAGVLGVMAFKRSSDAPAGTRSTPAPRSLQAGWSGRAELPWQREWASVSCADASRVTRVQRPRRSGEWSYRLRLRDGDRSYGERCELGQGNPTRPGFPLFMEGQERWISFSIFVPSAYPMPDATWNLVAQIKGLGPGGPPIALEAQDGRFILATATDAVQDHDRTRPRWSGRVVRDRWVNFTLRVKFSPDPAVGALELYGGVDSSPPRRLMQTVHTSTMKRDSTGAAIPSHSRIGPYRDPNVSGTATLYYDDYVVSSVAPSTISATSGRRSPAR